jgi:hypothetical protein
MKDPPARADHVNDSGKALPGNLGFEFRVPPFQNARKSGGFSRLMAM